MKTLKPFILFNLFLRQSVGLTDNSVFYKMWHRSANIGLSEIKRVEHKSSLVFDYILFVFGDKKISVRFLNKKDTSDFISELAVLLKNIYLNNLREYGIDALRNDYKSLIESDKYVAKYDIDLLSGKYAKLSNYCKSLLTDACYDRFKDKELSNQVNSVIELTSYGKKIKETIKERNEEFIKNEMVKYADFFKNFREYPYSEEQQRAIITFEDRNLLIAAAGSGKTATLIGKIGYAIEKGLYKPDEILLIVFNRAVKEEIKEKIQSFKTISAVSKNVYTFHGFGYKYLKGAEIDRKGEEYRIKNVVSRLIFSNKTFANNYINYVTVYAKDVIKGYSKDDYSAYVKNARIDRKLFKEKIYFKTIKGDLVKSYEELSIANFLFINGVDYVYEQEYPYVVKNKNDEIIYYHPDFYYPKVDIYHEHFAVNDKGTSLFGAKYINDIKLKRATHKKNKTVLIETTSAMFSSGTLFSCLQKTLEDYGIVFKQKTQREINNLIAESEEASRFAEIIKSFLDNFKEKKFAYKDVERKIAAMQNGYNKERATLFFKIFKAIYEEYKNSLKKENKIDYQDMISMSIPFIRNANSKYKLIMVDECQDISLSKAELLNAVLSVNPDSKFFAVGDDYQAINGFAGSEIKYMYNFKKEFADGKGLAINMLTKTYRCNQGIIDVSSKFISKNKKQIKKNIVTDNKDSAGTFVIKKYINEIDLFAQIKEDILALKNGKTVFFLANRYNNTFQKNGSYYENCISELKLNYSGAVHSDTIHQYKGRESDYVFLLMADDGIIPSEIVNDSLISLVTFKSEDDFLFAEERRLFYVALTRAKKGVYIYCKAGKQSAFVKEIIKDFKDTDVMVL